MQPKDSEETAERKSLNRLPALRTAGERKKPNETSVKLKTRENINPYRSLAKKNNSPVVPC
jgi:hypothetical protein